MMRGRIFIFIISLFLCNYSYAGEVSAYTKSILKAKNNSILKNSDFSDRSYHCYLHISELSVLDEIKELGLKPNSIIDDIVTINIPHTLIDIIANIEGVERVEMGTPVYNTLDVVRVDNAINSVHNAFELPSSYTGNGVIVGIIDQGIQLDHINFYNQQGELRIKRFWNQTDTLGIPPDGYDYGSEYVTQSEIETIKYDTDNGTHGIHVAGIAAGGYKGCNYYGVATDADIVFVSYNGYTSSISDAIAYIYDYADEVGKPAVINISIGGFIGPRDGTSDFDIIADELQGEGRILVGAAGNNGDTNSHISKTLSSSSDRLKTFMPRSYKLANHTSYNTDYVEIYGSSNTNLSITLSLYNKTTNEYISQSSTVSTMFGNATSYVLNNGIVGTIDVYSETLPSTKKPHILIVKSLTQASDDYAIEINIRGSKNCTIHAWSYMDTFESYGFTSHISGDSDYTVNEIGGTGNRIITVGSYVTKDIFGGNVGDISSQSSKGPTTDMRQKPDAVAPGEGIISSFSNSSNIAYSSYYKPYLDFGTTVNVGGETFYYGAMSGTSMAAPVVTGTIALWLQARPTLSPEEIKEIIANTSKTDEYTGDVMQTANTWGYGKIDAWAGLKMCLELNSIEDIETPNSKTLLHNYNNINGILKLLFVNDAKNINIKIYDISGKIIEAKHILNVVQGDEIVIDTSIYSKGVYIVKISGDTLIESFKIVHK